MSALRMALPLGLGGVAVALLAAVASCKHGDYDGSFDGSVDAGFGADGSAVTRLVQPDKLEVVTSTDNGLEVTFIPGTFSAAVTVTVAFIGEQTLDTGLVVPIYAVSADQTPTKVVQLNFRGNGNTNGGSDRVPLAALKVGTTFQPLPVVGSASPSYWGLSKTLGTFSLAMAPSGFAASFADTASSCTSRCCVQKGGQAMGFAGGCYCTAAPDLPCFVEQCADLDRAAARCSAVIAPGTVGSVVCKPFAASSTNCPGQECNGYPGSSCGTGGGGSGTNVQACCVAKNNGQCINGPQICPGFAARCTAGTPCPIDTTCCVFEDESYCAKSCPASQRACATDTDCADAGVDRGDAGDGGDAAQGATCHGGGCPVGVCGSLPSACR